MRRFIALALLLAGVSSLAFAAKPKPCLSAEEASRMVNKDVCVTAHVYDVVELPDGMRFLDICSPETTDQNCRFTIVSLWQDRESVGELRKFRDADVRVRGIVQPMHGRSGILLSHARQFNGGPPRFRPNPLLARGFSADQERPPVADPGLHTHGHVRAFMNSRDRETLPAK